ncbi:MAG: hypothetical protein IKU19_02725, partial [Clostridia bacterium]|nr:hypothetical protein [Clostridia bacterium]
WGYVVGEGNVIAKSGATVYEHFTIADWRGGSATSNMVDNSYGVFPFSQYYVQNIEAPLTLEAGASENGYMSINISVIGVQGSDVSFIGTSSAMFNIKSGSVTKYYDGSTDRMIIDINGDISMDPLSVSMKMGLLGSKTIKSEKYELPFTSHLTVNVINGTIYINQDVAMLPGAQMIIGENGKCVLGQGNSVYVYDIESWGGFVSPYNTKFYATPNAPSRTHIRTEADLVDAMVQVDGFVDASKGYLYTTEGGANVFTTGSGKVLTGSPATQTVTYQATYITDGADYCEIAIIPARLKNADGSYTSTAGEKNLYTYADGVWAGCTHNLINEGAVDATCTSTGLTAKVYCDICNIVYQEQSTVPVLPHTEVIVPAVAATCTESGLTEGKYCSVCNTVITEQTVVAALGHSYTSETTVAPTCTAEGLATLTCSVCSDTYTEVLVATGHNTVVDAAVAPTCTETGLTEGSHCDTCGEVFTAQEIVEATGHTEGEAVAENNVAPTCTTDGSYDSVVYCTVCNTELSRETVTVEATGHSYEAVVTAPTCTEAGYTTYTCVCGDTYTADETAPLGHTEGEAVEENYVEPTCTTYGSYELAVYCTVCKAELSRETVTVEILEHNYEISVCDPTCTAPGYTTYTCGTCGYNYTADETEAKGHSWDDGVVTA